MASGMTYTMTETTALSTAEYYGKALCELGAEHPEVVALTADLGKSTKIGMFGEKFPDRFFNVGIAEQNMFGVAAGLAQKLAATWLNGQPGLATYQLLGVGGPGKVQLPSMIAWLGSYMRTA